MAIENDKIFDQPRPHLWMQEHITYETRGDRLIKKIITRRFMGNDYQDSVETVVIGRASD